MDKAVWIMNEMTFKPQNLLTMVQIAHIHEDPEDDRKIKTRLHFAQQAGPLSSR